MKSNILISMIVTQDGELVLRVLYPNGVKHVRKIYGFYGSPSGKPVTKLYP